MQDHDRIVAADALEQAEQGFFQAAGGRGGVGRQYELQHDMDRLRETLHGLDGRGLEDMDYEPHGYMRLLGPRVSSDSARGWSRCRTPGKKSGPKRKVKKASDLVDVHLFMNSSNHKENKIAHSRVMLKRHPYFLHRANALCERYADEAGEMQQLRREFLALASTCRK